MRVVLVLAVAFSLQTSVCTGGPFALLKSAGEWMTTPATAYSNDTPMSFGSVGYLSCKDNSRAGAGVSNADTAGCQNGGACLSTVPSSLREQADTAIASVPVAMITPLAQLTQPSHMVAYEYTSDALPYPARSIAHTLLKRE